MVISKSSRMWSAVALAGALAVAALTVNGYAHTVPLVVAASLGIAVLMFTDRVATAICEVAQTIMLGAVLLQHFKAGNWYMVAFGVVALLLLGLVTFRRWRARSRERRQKRGEWSPQANRA